MSFGSRLKERREELGLKQSELGKMLGITGSAIGNYENGVSSPKADILYQVFSVLKCDANYLFQDEMKELDTDDLTVPEIKLAKKYRLLDQIGKEAVDGVLNAEYKRYEEKKAAQLAALQSKKTEMEAGEGIEAVFILPYYLHPSSAGTGEYSGGDEWEELSMTKRPPRGASYVIRVHGESMEPTYHDGDNVFVRAGAEVRMGQIGIFVMDGEQYIKELGDGVLISHNPDPKYAPRPMVADTRCQGLVLGVCDESYFD